MKNILKKNQVIITALLIMIVVAGYLQFTKDNADDAQQMANSQQEVSDEIADSSTSDVLGIDDATSELLTADGSSLDISEEDNQKVEAVTANEAEDMKDKEKQPDDKKDAENQKKEDSEKSGETTAKNDDESAGEAVLVNTTIGPDFFSAKKLEREQVRAKNKDVLMKLIENTTLSEAQQQKALDKVLEMTTIAEKENAAETWLEAKGFDGAVVTIIDGKVDVVVGVHDTSDQTIAQIEDIVKNKTGAVAADIKINAVEVTQGE